MISQPQILQVRGFLDTAQSVLVLIGPDSNLDVLAASSALFLSLEQSGKDVIYASPDLPSSASPDSSSEIDQNLIGVDRVRTEISNKNLIISFDYAQTAVEKVNYHIGEETNRFYLTVAPQKGHQPLNKDTVDIGYVGAEADLIFLVGVADYESLEHLYVGNEQLFTDTTVIAINNFEATVGDVRLNTAESLNLSSAVAEIIRQTNLEITGDAATNLLLSIEETTDSFRSLAITPDLLETAAWLMRQGARRVRRASSSMPASVPSSVPVKPNKSQLHKSQSQVVKVKKVAKPKQNIVSG
ncbi:hypothetical protein KJ654_02430 [Patescibacteria group bacterium]|nr:hypothetical protein [Patescibacteria group bacterium]